MLFTLSDSFMTATRMDGFGYATTTPSRSSFGRIVAELFQRVTAPVTGRG